MNTLIRQDLTRMVEEAEAEGRITRDRAAPAKGAGRFAVSTALVEQARAAVTDLSRTASYKALKARLEAGNLNAHEVQDWMARAMEGPEMAPLVTALRETPELFSLDDFIPHAVSLGLMGEIQLVFIGGSGSFGYVQDISISDANPMFYLGGVVDIGLDLGFQGDIVVGFWTQTTDDIGGNYVGAEVDVDDGGGGSLLGFEQDGEPAIVYVAAGLGAIDGADIDDMYVFTEDIGMPPVYQSGDGTYYIQLKTLTCDNSYSNWDEVMIEFSVDGDDTTYSFPGWKGYSMSESQRDDAITTWNVGAVIKCNSSAKVTLKIEAIGNDPDLSVTFYPSDFAGLNSSFSRTFDQTFFPMDEVKYTLSAVLVKD